MLSNRIVPLIVAVALFMENMDSTVIATSLPAIAADIGTTPLALKLAITSYLLSLAVFLPISGWTADRFGARTVFRAAIMLSLISLLFGCDRSGPYQKQNGAWLYGKEVVAVGPGEALTPLNAKFAKTLLPISKIVH